MNKRSCCYNMAFNILEPKISRVAKGLDGKVILVYGSNSTGKTMQGTRMEKPLVLPFEHGLNALANIPFFPINSWSDFKKVNMSLTNPRTLDQVKEKYQTIIFDEVDASANYCQEYLCKKHDVESIGEGNNGYGLWKEYETEYWREINRLTKAGFTVYFIAHAHRDRDSGQIVPKGDKRAIDPIVDLADITIFLQSSGIDENGKIIKSRGHLAETDEFFARSRFQYIETFMPEFTAENLEKYISDAIKKQEEIDGVKAVEHEEQAKMHDTELDYDELIAGIGEEFTKLKEADRLDEYQKIVEDEFGMNVRISEVPEDQLQSLDLVLFNLKELE